MNRPAPGFDIDGYKKKLTEIDVHELANELSVQEINYPCLLIGVGSVLLPPTE